MEIIQLHLYHLLKVKLNGIVNMFIEYLIIINNSFMEYLLNNSCLNILPNFMMATSSAGRPLAIILNWIRLHIYGVLQNMGIYLVY